MKISNILLVIALAILSLHVNAQAKQAVKKQAVQVWGNCEMCQSRIEKAAKLAGASSAKWDVDSKTLSVSYNPARVSINNIEKTVAAAGYDTEHVKGSDSGYKKLPGCCQYERKDVTTTKAE